MLRYLRYVFTLVLASVMAACGGGGGSSGLPSGTANPITTSAGTELTLAVGAAQSFSIIGGKAPYQIASSNVQVALASISGETFAITALAVGDAKITLSDASQQSAEIALTVANLAEFSTSAPEAITVAPQSTSQPYYIGGGVQGAGYRWSSSDSRVATAQIEGNVLRINGWAVGEAKIVLQDSSPVPAVKEISVTVSGGTTRPLYTTAPGNITVAPQSLTTFPIGGGVPPYLAPTSTNPSVATASINASNMLSIQAGNALGTATIDVHDIAGNRLSMDGKAITVTVNSLQTDPLYTTIPSGGVAVAVGFTREFQMGGGVAAYTAVSVDENIATVSINSNNTLFIKGITKGSTNITLRDRAGTTLSYAVSVGATAVISHTVPATGLSMAAGTVRNFSVNGGRSPYTPVSNNDAVAFASVSGSTLSVTALSAGSASIVLFDAAGNASEPFSVTVTGGSSGSQVPSSVELISSKVSLLSAGDEAVITAFVKGSGNVGIEGQAVTFSASSGVIQNAVKTTDAAGVATATLIPGSDKSNRAIEVQVFAGTAVSGKVTVQVSGTNLTVSGASSLQVSTAAKPVTAVYTLRALDSSGNPISGAALSVASSLGNILSAASATTDATGTASVTYTPVKAGSDVLTVSGLGATSQTDISISAVDLSVVSPAPDTTIPIGSSQLVTVLYQLNGVGQAGKTVSFSTTRGTIAPDLTVSLPAGQYAARLSSTTAGQATVTAQISGVGSVTLPVEFVATVPATVTLQSNPGAIAPNPTGTVNQSAISAVVRDAAGNPVKNRQVNFTLVSDLSNGTLSSGSAITNSNGLASVQFIAGPSSTPNNGVEVRAVDALTGLSGTTKLTVSGQSLFINIGFGNEIGNVDPTTYKRDFSVYVTDANGVAVGNQVITLSVIPVEYGKGYLTWSGTQWVRSSISATCSNEDTLLGSGAVGYLNGILNSGEDFNGDGRLTPGNVAVAAPGSVTTDADGRANFSVQYGEQFAPWGIVEIEARAVVSGTESKRTILYPLEGSAPDFTQEDVPPAGTISPFGTSEVLPRTSPRTYNGLCSNPN